MTMKLQLALQGGGAKIYSLIAALEVIDEAVQNERIEITRIAGTSAGAIVGALYAAGVGPAEMRAEFSKPDLVPEVPAPPRAICRALRGKPLVNDHQLRTLIERLLRRGKPPDKPLEMKELGRPCFIIASDICNRIEVTYDRSSPERVVDCVMRSCGIPFFFVSHGGKDIIVDGGLCSNLPSDVLSSGIRKYGDILAISFSDYARRAPTSAIGFAKTLLDTAINASVARAKSGSNVFVVELNPYGVGTFDFVEGQRNLDPDRAPYQEAKSRTEKVVKDILKPGRVVGGSLWTSADPAVMKDLWEVYECQEAPRRFKYLRRRFSAVANSLVDQEAEDVLVQEIEFSAGAFDINSLVAQLSVKEGGSPGNVLCEVTELSGRREVSFRPLPLKLLSDRETEGSEPEANEPRMDKYGLLICFTPPLAAGDAAVYQVRVEYGLRRAFPGLEGSSRTDHLISQAGLRADGPVPLMELILYVPKAISGVLTVAPMTRKAGEPLREEPDGGRSPGYREFDYHRWLARDVNPDEKIGVELRLKKSSSSVHHS